MRRARSITRRVLTPVDLLSRWNRARHGVVRAGVGADAAASAPTAARRRTAAAPSAAARAAAAGVDRFARRRSGGDLRQLRHVDAEFLVRPREPAEGAARVQGRGALP